MNGAFELPAGMKVATSVMLVPALITLDCLESYEAG